MDFTGIDKKIAVHIGLAHKGQALWQNKFKNAERIAKFVRMFFDLNKRDFELRNIPVQTNDEPVYLRSAIGDIHKRIDVSIVFMDEEFYLIAEKGTKRLYAFEKMLTTRWVYDDVDAYFEKLLTEHYI